MSVTVTKRKISKEQETTVIILGGGRSPRMGNYGAKLSIVLPNNHTLLQHQVDLVNKLVQNSDIYTTIGYDADRVIAKRPNNVKLIENGKWDNTGEVEEIRLILNCTNLERLLILTGDIYTTQIPDLNLNESFCTSIKSEDNEQVGLKCEDNYINLFSFSFNDKFLGMVNLVGNELAYIRKFINREYAKLALWELIEEYTKAGYKIKNQELNSHKTVKINTSKDLNKIKAGGGIL